MKNTSTRKQPATKATVTRPIVQRKGLRCLSACRLLQGGHTPDPNEFPSFPSQLKIYLWTPQHYRRKYQYATSNQCLRMHHIKYDSYVLGWIMRDDYLTHFDQNFWKLHLFCVHHIAHGNTPQTWTHVSRLFQFPIIFFSDHFQILKFFHVFQVDGHPVINAKVHWGKLIHISTTQQK